MIWFGLLAGLFMAEPPFVDGKVEEILAKAQAEKKLIFVDVYTTWCGPCKLLDRTTWKDEKVKEILSSKVVSYKIDAEKGEGPAFAKKYRVSGYPSLLILNSKGELVDRHIGYIHPRQFLAWIDKNFD